MKVKVTRVRGGSMGDQRNYGLVTGSIWNYEDKPTTNGVMETMKEVPREDATIEAERNETIVYPNPDGDIVHAKIGGKRHSEGGTPLDAPDGAFVYSDFKAGGKHGKGLLIKNQDVLSGIFGIKGKKSKTPAQIAKKFGLNQYYDILNDPEATAMEIKTAQMMIENNLKKLGQLALIQEGMKGFPDGIPDIALPLFGSDIAAAQPSAQPSGTPMARYGGSPLPVHQIVGETGDVREGSTIYINGKPVKIKYIYDSIAGNPYAEFEKPIKLSPADHPNKSSVTRMRVDDIKKGLKQGNLAMDWGAGFLGSNQDLIDISSFNMPDWDLPGRAPKYVDVQFSMDPEKKEGRQYIKPEVGFQFKYNNIVYEVDDPNVYDADEPYVQVRETRDKSWSPSSFFSSYGGKWLIPLRDFQKMYMSDRLKGSNAQTNNEVVEKENITDGEFVDNPLSSDGEKKSDKQTVTPAQQPAPLTKRERREWGAEQLRKAKEEISIMFNNAPIDSIDDVAARTHLLNKGAKPEGDIIKKRSGGSIISFDPTTNTVLDVLQKGKQKGTAKPVYDIEDKDFRDWMESQGFDIITPDYYNQYMTSIGSQTPGTSDDYETLPTGEIVPKGGLKGYTGIDDLITYHKSHGVDFSKYPGAKDEATGIDLFKKDIAARTTGKPTDRQKHKSAMQWLFKSGDEINEKALRDAGLDPAKAPKQYDPNITDYDILGAENVLGYKYIKPKAKAPAAPAAPATPAPAAAKDVSAPAPKQPTYQSGFRPSPFPDYALFDLFNVMGTKVSPGPLPPLTQFAYTATPPTLLDPARTIAQQQGLVSQTQNEMTGFQPTPVSRANIIAAQAKAADPIADAMAKYDMANAEIMNKFDQTRDTFNRDMLVRNAAAREKYLDALATRQQNYENAVREQNQAVVDSYRRARRDQMSLAAMNQLNPSYSYDPFGNIVLKPGYTPQDTQTPGEFFNYLREQNVTPDVAARVAYGKGMSASPYNYDPMESVWNQFGD